MPSKYIVVIVCMYIIRSTSFSEYGRRVDVFVGDKRGCKSPSSRRAGQLPVYWVP